MAELALYVLGVVVVSVWEDVGFLALGAEPHVVVDRADLLFEVLGGGEERVVADFVEAGHAGVAVGAVAGMVAPVVVAAGGWWPPRGCRRPRR